MHLPDFLQKYEDDYTSTWISSSPLFPLSFILFYIIFHSIYHPDYNQPIQYRSHWTLIKSVILLSTNFGMTLMFGLSAQELNYTLWCTPVDPPPSKSPASWTTTTTSQMTSSKRRMMKDLYFYLLLAKLLECLDTIVISLRGGLYPTWVFIHHSTMIVLVWIAMVFVPGGTASIWAFVNCLGHIFIYLFGTLKYLMPQQFGDKTYLLQLFNDAQFIAIILTSISAAWNNCGFPLEACLLSGSLALGLFMFFKVRVDENVVDLNNGPDPGVPG